MKAKIKRSIGCSTRWAVAVLMAVSGAIFIAGFGQTAAAADAALREDASKSAASAGSPEIPNSASPAGGTREGIGVHGWWTIEVRNPDGSVDRHLEFENQLCTMFRDPTTNVVVPGGDSTLASILSPGLVGASISAGNEAGVWSIVLGQSELPSGVPGTPTFNPPANCAFNVSYTLSNSPNLIPLTLAAPVIPNVNAAPIALTCSLNNNGGGNCYPNLTVTVTSPSTVGAATVMTLSGQFTVPTGTSPVTISAVGTDLFTCANNGQTAICSQLPNVLTNYVNLNTPCQVQVLTIPSTATFATNRATTYISCGTDPTFSINTYPVGGQWGRAPFSGVVLGTAGNPTPITVVGGQVVSVTWSLSFQ